MFWFMPNTSYLATYLTLICPQLRVTHGKELLWRQWKIIPKLWMRTRKLWSLILPQRYFTRCCTIRKWIERKSRTFLVSEFRSRLFPLCLTPTHMTPSVLCVRRSGLPDNWLPIGVNIRPIRTQVGFAMSPNSSSKCLFWHDTVIKNSSTL